VQGIPVWRIHIYLCKQRLEIPDVIYTAHARSVKSRWHWRLNRWTNNAHKIFVRRLEKDRPLDRPRLWQKAAIKMDLTEVEFYPVSYVAITSERCWRRGRSENIKVAVCMAVSSVPAKRAGERSRRSSSGWGDQIFWYFRANRCRCCCCLYTAGKAQKALGSSVLRVL
jgi:hypothetical protein